MRGRLLVAAWLATGGLAPPAAAQAPSTLAGTVVDGISGDPIDGAEVRFGRAVIVTGADGRFDFGAVSPGAGSLTVRRIGYSPAAMPLEILPAAAHERIVSLRPQPVELDTLLVVPESLVPAIGYRELVARGKSLATALDGWEGITIRPGPDGSAAPTLRGSAPDEVLVVLDGFPLNDPYTGRADLRRIPTATVAEVRLHPGAQGAAFGGRAIAGVVDIVTRDDGEGELSLHGGSHGTSGGLARVGLQSFEAAVASDGLADGYAYRVPEVRGEGEAERANAGGRVWSFNLRRSGTTEATIRGSASERGLPGPVTNPTPTAHGADWSVLAGVRHRGTVDASAGLQFLSSRFADPTPPIGLPYESDTRGVDASMRLGRQLVPPGRPLALRAGFEGGYTTYAGDNIPSNADRWRTAFNIAADWRASNAVRLSTTGRLDWWSDLDAPVGSLRADLRLSLGKTVLSAGGGSSVAPPVLADLFFREGNGVRVNPHLQPERVRWELEVGVRHATAIGPVKAEAGLRGYAGRVDDMVLWGQSPGYRFAWMPQNFDVERRGAEVSLALRPRAGVSLGANAGVSRLTRPWDGAPQLPYRPWYTVAATAGWEHGRLRLDGRWHLVSERNRDYSGVNQLPSYAQLGLGIEFTPMSRIRVRGDVEDLLDRQPAYIAGYPTAGRTLTATLSYELP